MILFSSCLFLSAIFQVTTGDAYLSLRLLTFRNPGGMDKNGHCCDGRYTLCFSECDHSFTFCIDQIDGSRSDIGSCSYGRQTSGKISNEDNINFKDRIGKLRNPILLRLKSWPGQVRLKVDVTDVDDHNSNDAVDFLWRDISLLPSSNLQGARISLNNRVVLTLEARVFCGQLFYGMNCSVFCQADPQRYECDQQLGTKICHRGWLGSECDINQEDCADVVCQNGGSCLDLVNSFQCICQVGYTGRFCEVDIDECLISSNCLHGDCANSPGTYTCSCHRGFSGSFCDVNINECEQHPCQNGGTCIDHVADFTCSCSVGFSGDLCELDINECAFDPCRNNATCVNSMGTYQCDCLSGYHGNDCSMDIDECASLPCQNGARCNNSPGGYDCKCEPGFEGLNCQEDIDECDTPEANCTNGATCHNLPGNYNCTCAPGYEGRWCQVDIDECDAIPCHNQGTCQNGPGNFSCLCLPGYTGVLCDENIDECLNNICKNGGACQDLPGSFVCTCPEFWEGPTCEENINECLDQPCYYGGTCQDVDDGFICVCPREFLGSLCQQDTDECEQHICQNQATCINVFGGYHCECTEGWTGQRCESDIDECTSLVCNNFGTCVNTPGSAHCQCPINWRGSTCETDVDECEVSPCRNNGTCHNMVGTFLCQCPPTWSGALCDMDVNECAQVPEICSLPGNSSTPQLGDGTDKMVVVANVMCVNIEPGYLCTCAPGWLGENCDVALDQPESVTSSSPEGHVDLPTFNATEIPPGGQGITEDQFADRHTRAESTVQPGPGHSSLAVPEQKLADAHQEGRTSPANDNSTYSSGGLTIPFYLACRISPAIRWTVDRGLKQLLEDTRLFVGKTLTVDHKSEIGTSESGETVTSISPVVTVDGRELSDQEVGSILNKVTYKFNNYLYCPLYTGAVSGKFRFSTQTLNSATPNWYPGLITACVLLFVVAVAIIAIKCHRSKESRQKTYQINSMHKRLSVGGQAVFSGCPTTDSSRPGDSPPLGGDRKPLVKFKPAANRSVISIMNPLYATLDEMQEGENGVDGNIETERDNGRTEETAADNQISVAVEVTNPDDDVLPEAVVATTLEAEESRYSVPPNNSCAITGKLAVTVNQPCKVNDTTISPCPDKSSPAANSDSHQTLPSTHTTGQLDDRNPRTQTDRTVGSLQLQDCASPEYISMHRPDLGLHHPMENDLPSSTCRPQRICGSTSEEETDTRYKNLPYIDDPALVGRTRLQSQNQMQDVAL